MYCDPYFIQSFTYDEDGTIEIDYNTNVCYQFQRKCFKFIEFRSLAAGVKNLVYMLEKLYSIKVITDKLKNEV